MTGDREYVISGIRRLKGRTFKALLGKGDSGHTVAVAGKSNYVWVRVKYGSSLGAPVQALNRNVPPIHGRVVRVKEIDRAGIKGYEVIDFDDTGTPYYHDDTSAVVLPKHGWTHECSQDAEANDPVNLYTRCWAELRVEPTDPCSLYTYVTHGWYLFDTPTWFTGGNSPLFVPPAMGMRYDLVYIDSSGTIGIEQGDIGGFVATIPEPPDYTIPLAAIQLTGSVGCIEEAMILDCRVMPNVKYPSGGAVFDDSITPSVIYPDLAPWPGTQDYPSRGDHKHGANCAVANVIVPDATTTEGVSTSFSRADHTHGIVCDIPGFIHAVDTLSLEGTGTSFARADHIHGLNVAAPVSVGSANAEGASTEFVRRDHVHQGVHSLSETGQAQLFGDITLSEGANVTLTQAGQDIQIASAGGGGVAAVHQHDGPLAAQGGNVLNPTTLYVTGTATFADGVYALNDVNITDDLIVGDHASMATGTVTGYFNIGENLTVAHDIVVGGLVDGVDVSNIVCDVELIGTYLVGPDKTGNARGTQAIDIQTYRALVTQVASGEHTIAIGENATAGPYAYVVAIGHYATAGVIGGNDIAIGQGANTGGYAGISQNIAVGLNATGYNSTYSVAIGSSAKTAAGKHCIAIGMNAYAKGVGAGQYGDGIAIGYAAYAYQAATAIGYMASAARSAFAMGPGANASTYATIAIGMQPYAAGYGIAIGKSSNADGINYLVDIGPMIGVNSYNFRMTPTGKFSMMDWKVRRNPVARVVAATHTLSIDLNGSTYHVLLTSVAP